MTRKNPELPVDLAGVIGRTEHFLGRRLPNTEHLCGQDFACFEEPLTSGEVMTAFLSALKVADPDGQRVLPPDAWVASADDAAQLAIAIGRMIAEQYDDVESFVLAVEYILGVVHKILGEEAGCFPTFQAHRLSVLSRDLSSKIKRCSPKEIAKLCTRAATLEEEANTLGSSIFKFFPSTSFQVSFLQERGQGTDPSPSPPVSPTPLRLRSGARASRGGRLRESEAGLTAEEFEMLFVILEERRKADSRILRSDEEFLTCVQDARRQVILRQELAARLAEHLHRFLALFGIPQTCAVSISLPSDIPELGKLSRCAAFVRPGPLPDTLLIAIATNESAGVVEVIEQFLKKR